MCRRWSRTEAQTDYRNQMLALALRTVTNEGLIAPGIDADQSWRRSTWFGRRRATSSSVCLPNLQVLEQFRVPRGDKSRRLEAIFRARHGRLTYVHELAFRGHTCRSRGRIDGPRISAQLLQLDRPEGFINPLSAGCNKVISSRSSLTHLPCQIAFVDPSEL